MFTMPASVRKTIEAKIRTSYGMTLRRKNDSIGWCGTRFVNPRKERNNLWQTIMVEKYREERGGWEATHPKTPYGTSVWRGISNLSGEFRSHCILKLGDGKDICFWLDVWCSDIPLKDRFQSLFRFVADASFKVEGLWKQEGDEGSWSFRINWCIPATISQVLHLWPKLKLPAKGKKLWFALPHAVIWTIWKTRNTAIFNGGKVE
ncbi:hypothetical protein BVC80_1439g10 [Macleaya cordata]|uniref:Reverse transcriptase zinc-binding domain n=1 Tax=Macleaya cordata TaxID=56857 RepID=A0A200QC77_MACCD|nr:hypothetical protein BVC80_1439g10 [Macleaya cordata]